MFRHNSRWLVLLAPAALLVFSASGCKQAASAEEEESNLPKQPVPVRAVRVEKTVLKPSIDLVGTLVAIPERTILVSPQTAGWIQEIKVVEGGRVRAGEELLRLDSRFAEAEYARAVAAVNQQTAILDRLKHGPRPEEIEIARHEADKARTTMEALREEIEALKPLRARNEVSLVQFQKAQSSLRAAEADSAAAAARLKLLELGTRPEEIAEAEARLEVAKAELTTAKLNLALCRVTSPIEGMVTQLTARPGMYVDRSATLATIVDLSEVFMQIRIPSAYLARVKLGAKVDVRVASLEGKTYSGTIARMSGQADPATGDVDALASINNDDGLLRPGLACRGCLWLPELAGVVAIPHAAVADRSGTPVVTLVHDGKARETEVTLGIQTRELTQVLAGVSPGDWVVTEGGYGLPDDCPVTIQPPETPAATPAAEP
jgi:multidrug efflux pump subunit AcrA (membrane-fusion protein)